MRRRALTIQQFSVQSSKRGVVLLVAIKNGANSCEAEWADNIYRIVSFPVVRGALS